MLGLAEPPSRSSQVLHALSVVEEHPVVLPIRIEPHVLVLVILPIRMEPHVMVLVILPIRMEPHVMVPGASHHCSTS